MSRIETTEVFDCSVDDFFKIVTDYEKYPEFLTEVKSCRIIESHENKKLVEYQISLIKSFKYRLWMTEIAPHEISWELDSGDFFKKSSGHWNLKDEAGKTRADYCVDTQFKVFVPSPVANTLVKVNLPNMMSAYKKRVGEIYG